MNKRIRDRSAALLLLLALAAAAPPGRGDRDHGRGERPGPVPTSAWDSTYRPLPRADTLIVNANILDGAGGRIDGGWVLSREGKIVGMGPGAPTQTAPTVIDAKGRWLTPGIIDIHSHDGTFVAPLTANDAEYSDVSEVSSPNAAGNWVEHSINVQDPNFRRALESGVTTLQILPGSIPLIGGRSVVLKNVPANDVTAMKFPGAQQGVKMSCGDNARSFYGSKGGAPNSRMGAMKMFREIFARSRAGRSEGHPPPGDNMDAQTIDGILSGDLRVHIHCYRADDMTNMLNVAKEFGFHITAFHHATEAYKITSRLNADGTLRGGVGRLVGLQVGSGRRDPRECRLRRCVGWLRRDALGFAVHGPASEPRSREGDGLGRASGCAGYEGTGATLDHVRTGTDARAGRQDRDHRRWEER